MQRSRADEAAAAGQRLFPPGCEVAAYAIGEAPEPWRMEAPAVAGAVPARKAEFAAGRAAARTALVALGLPEVAIPTLQTRAPSWPPGIAGSIAHADGVAMAVLAPSRQCRALGLDIEPDSPFPEDLLSSVTLPSERRWLAAQTDPARAARLIFTAKEAAYKCQFPLSQSLIGFEAIAITMMTGNRLRATFTRDVAPFAKGQSLYGRVTHAAGLIITGFILPH